MLFHPQTTYGSDRFRQIFIAHWYLWLDLHEEDIPADQRAYVRKTIQTMIGCRNPQSGYARYVCPGCGDERIVPFSCKTLFCPSCGKVRTTSGSTALRRNCSTSPIFTLLSPSLRNFARLSTPIAAYSIPCSKSLPKPSATQSSPVQRAVLITTQFIRDWAPLCRTNWVGMCTALGVVEDEYPGLRIGLIYTCHTFGRDLDFKPHIHLVMTKGGLDRHDPVHS